MFIGCHEFNRVLYSVQVNLALLYCCSCLWFGLLVGTLCVGVLYILRDWFQVRLYAAVTEELDYYLVTSGRTKDSAWLYQLLKIWVLTGYILFRSAVCLVWLNSVWLYATIFQDLCCYWVTSGRTTDSACHINCWKMWFVAGCPQFGIFVHSAWLNLRYYIISASKDLGYWMPSIWKFCTLHKIKSSITVCYRACVFYHHCVASKLNSHQEPEHCVRFPSLLSITIMPNSMVKRSKLSCETKLKYILCLLYV